MILRNERGIEYERKSFVSYPANTLAMKYSSNRPGMQNLILSYAPNPVSEGSLESDGNNGIVWKARLDNNSMQYTLRIKASFAPLDMLTTEEVIEIGDDLGLPYELTHKVPVDGLQPLSDEEKFGFSYHEINELIRKGIRGEHYDKIMKMFNAGKFKLEMLKFAHFDPKRPDFFLEHFGI